MAENQIQISKQEIARLATSRGIIEHGQTGVRDQWNDKVCIVAKPTFEKGALFLDISDSTPSATMNNDLADALQTQHGVKTYSVPRLRSGLERGPEWLISCGTIMHNSKGDLMVFERTITNPANGKLIAWPGALNNPMGRGDGLPSTTCLKEGAEELGLYRPVPPSSAFNNMPRYQPVQFIVDGKRGVSEQTEEELTDKLMKHLQAKQTPFAGDLENVIGTIEAKPDGRYKRQLTTVATRLNGLVVDEFQAIAVTSPTERTIEIARPLRLQGENNLTVYAREPFGRPMKQASPEQLKAAHYAWARGMSGKIDDPEQNCVVHIGGILPILQGAILGLPQAASRPSEVTVPKAWTESRIKSTLGLK